jgi:AhpD family alkylhydroperoxidase
MDQATYEGVAANTVAALAAFGRAVDDSGLDKPLTELLKIRVSQINGCAFCLQYHLNLARKFGVPAVKIDLVATWREAGVHSTRERAALAWAESLTRMATQTVDDAVHAALMEHFSTREVAHLTAAIANINAWNRIAGALQFAPLIPAGHGTRGAAA